MFEILVNDTVVAIAAENVVKIFVSALVDKLPIELSIATRRYNPAPQQVAQEAQAPVVE